MTNTIKSVLQECRKDEDFCIILFILIISYFGAIYFVIDTPEFWQCKYYYDDGENVTEILDKSLLRTSNTYSNTQIYPHNKEYEGNYPK